MKTQQPLGCEDFSKERNAADRCLLPSPTVFAATPSLTIEITLADNLTPTLLEPTPTPVLLPPDKTLRPKSHFRADLPHCPAPGCINLRQRLPAGRGKSRSENPETVAGSISSGVQKPVAETLKAAAAALRHGLYALHTVFRGKGADAGKPRLMIVVGIDDVETERSSIARTLVLADKIFLFGIDIRIAVIDCGTNSAPQKTLDDCA